MFYTVRVAQLLTVSIMLMAVLITDNNAVIFAKACKNLLADVAECCHAMKALLDTAAHFHNISFCPLSLLTAVLLTITFRMFRTFIIAPTEETVTLPHRNLKVFVSHRNVLLE